MPKKSNNTGGHGGKRSGSGRKSKSVVEKYNSGNPGGRKLTVLNVPDLSETFDIPEIKGVKMPEPDAILSAEQNDGSVFKAKEIYEEVWKWLDSLDATRYVSPQMIEHYAVCRARWLQCEEVTNDLGFLSEHPTTGKPIPSPFINIGINYLNQATRQWDAIMQLVKENCSTEYRGTPNDNLMEQLLSSQNA